MAIDCMAATVQRRARTFSLTPGNLHAFRSGGGGYWLC